MADNFYFREQVQIMLLLNIQEKDNMNLCQFHSVKWTFVQNSSKIRVGNKLK